MTKTGILVFQVAGSATSPQPTPISFYYQFLDYHPANLLCSFQPHRLHRNLRNP